MIKTQLQTILKLDFGVKYLRVGFRWTITEKNETKINFKLFWMSSSEVNGFNEKKETTNVQECQSYVDRGGIGVQNVEDYESSKLRK